MKLPPIFPLLVRSVIGRLWYDPSKMPAGILEHGKEIYDQLCWRGHGSSGKSAGPVSDAMNRRPRDLTDQTYMSTVSDEALLNVIKNGGLPSASRLP